MNDQIEPFEMNEHERRTDVALDEALSPGAVAEDVTSLEQRIVDATFTSLPDRPEVAGRVGRQTPVSSRGLSPAWRIAAVLALGMMSTLVIAVWQVQIPSPSVANASPPGTSHGTSPATSNETNFKSSQAFATHSPASTRDDDAAFFLALTETNQDPPSAESLDAELDMIGLQIELMLAREVFASPEESLDEVIEQDPLLMTISEESGLF